ncbi:hypothetical protein CMU07_09145 [Elizabethkingia anophelis]|nr:hypothetical protein [Elizabethkingia anophelis]
MNTKYVKVSVSERLPEEWRDAVGYEDYYEVSNYGNVRSKNRSVLTKKGNVINFKSKLQKLTLNRIGYYTVCFKVRAINLNKTITVHRLVALAFIENPNNYPVINHKDLNPLNNNVENLEWCTQSDNIKHAIKHGLIVKNSFEYKNSKLNIEQLQEIKELLKDPNHVVKDIAAKFNVTYMVISKIKNNRTYQHLSTKKTK